MTDKQREARQRESRRIFGPNLEPWHVSECRLLPSRRHLLQHIPKGGIAAEVGVAFGDFSSEIIAYAQPKVLHLIDIWAADRYSAGFERVVGKFQSEIDQGSVVINKNLSLDGLSKYASGTFDFVYIDTIHDYDLTLQELVLASTKMKPGGLIGGHDFCSGNVVAPVVYGVIQACHRFCREYNWRYKYLTLETGTSFSFCLEKGAAPELPTGSS